MNSTHREYGFRTLYVSAREVSSLPASAIPVSQLLGVGLKGYLPTRLFINLDGKWYEVSVSRGENWPRLRIAWSSITAMAVRFLHDRGVRDFPYIGKYLSKEPPSMNTQYIAEIGEWYLHPPEGGKPAVEALHRIEKHTGILPSKSRGQVSGFKPSPGYTQQLTTIEQPQQEGCTHWNRELVPG